MVDLEALLHSRFSAPKWASFTELRQATSFDNGDGRIDFAAFSMQAYVGDRTVACEVKRSRSDFLREIKSPNKRKWVETQFRECYFVVPNALVDVNEVPEGWGLLVATAKGTKLRQVRMPMQRDVEIGQPLLRSIIRRAAALQDTSNLLHLEHHGEGQCVPYSMYIEAGDLASHTEMNTREIRQTAREALAPLNKLASLAGEYGIRKWSESLVQELVERVATKRVTQMMTQIQRASLELENLLSLASDKKYLSDKDTK